MKRREFVLRSGGAALLGAIPLSAAATARAPLLDDPAAWIGTRFTLSDGSRLELTGVESVARDLVSTQSRLQFRTVSGTPPCEGLHALSTAWDGESLFLQAGREGPVACINRLHRGV